MRDLVRIRRSRWAWLTACAAVCLLVGQFGCEPSSNPSGSDAPTVPMEIGSRSYHLEVAADDASREHGLMERDTLAADHGMIFVFPADTTDPFWMHHTRFPLDILFIDAGAKVVSVKHMKAYDESNTFSDGPYRYAVELAAGQTDADGAKLGDQLKIPAEAAKPSR